MMELSGSLLLSGTPSGRSLDLLQVPPETTYYLNLASENCIHYGHGPGMADHGQTMSPDAIWAQVCDSPGDSWSFPKNQVRDV